MNIIDINFDFRSDSNGGDPDIASPTLRKYHKILWSKKLPNGKDFELTTNNPKGYLYHKSEIGEFFLGSDAITHSYRNHKKKQWLISQFRNEAQELFDICANIASYIVFPNKRINNSSTINQARGVNAFIDDRFDLTLECIRLYYQGKKSPLYETLLTYHNFFELFENFEGYTNYFLLQDLIDENQNVMFYLPFDNFKSKPGFKTKEDYLMYKKNVINFNFSRKNRILNYANKL